MPRGLPACLCHQLQALASCHSCIAFLQPSQIPDLWLVRPVRHPALASCMRRRQQAQPAPQSAGGSGALGASDANADQGRPSQVNSPQSITIARFYRTRTSQSGSARSTRPCRSCGQPTQARCCCTAYTLATPCTPLLAPVQRVAAQCELRRHPQTCHSGEIGAAAGPAASQAKPPAKDPSHWHHTCTAPVHVWPPVNSSTLPS